MKILALEKEVPDKTAADFQPHLTSEAEKVWELYQAGVIREIYFRSDRHEAVLILECANAAEARETLNTLPLVKEQLIDFEILPLVAYPGFARLFAASPR